jgi:hypothetical protein
VNAPDPVVLADRPGHRVTIALNETGKPISGICICGALWSLQGVDTATVWAQVHVAPPPDRYDFILAVKKSRARVIRGELADDWQRRIAGNPLIVTDRDGQ